MDYHEAMSIWVSATEAQSEIEKHELDFTDFMADYGSHDTYTGSDVLNWLGY